MREFDQYAPVISMLKYQQMVNIIYGSGMEFHAAAKYNISCRHDNKILYTLWRMWFHDWKRSEYLNNHVRTREKIYLTLRC